VLNRPGGHPRSPACCRRRRVSCRAPSQIRDRHQWTSSMWAPNRAAEGVRQTSRPTPAGWHCSRNNVGPWTSLWRWGTKCAAAQWGGRSQISPSFKSPRRACPQPSPPADGQQGDANNSLPPGGHQPNQPRDRRNRGCGPPAHLRMKENRTRRPPGSRASRRRAARSPVMATGFATDGPHEQRQSDPAQQEATAQLDRADRWGPKRVIPPFPARNSGWCARHMQLGALVSDTAGQIVCASGGHHSCAPELSNCDPQTGAAAEAAPRSHPLDVLFQPRPHCGANRRAICPKGVSRPSRERVRRSRDWIRSASGLNQALGCGRPTAGAGRSPQSPGQAGVLDRSEIAASHAVEAVPSPLR